MPLFDFNVFTGMTSYTRHIIKMLSSCQQQWVLDNLPITEEHRERLIKQLEAERDACTTGTPVAVVERLPHTEPTVVAHNSDSPLDLVARDS